MNSVEQAVASLVTREPFYGHFLVGMRRIYTNKIATAGVSITDKINLYVNLDFFGKLTLDERVAVLKHEAHHVMNLHPARKKERHHLRWNVACDVAINQYIQNIPKAALQPSFFPKPVENLQTADYYYDQLDKQKDDILKKYGKEPGEGDTLDDHTMWEESTASEEEASSVVREAAKDAKDKAGNLPGNLESILSDLYKSRIDWRTKLRQFFQASQRYSKTVSRKKRNRRYGVIYSGRKKEEHLRLYMAVDSSGSVSDEELKLFFSEIDGIAKLLPISVKVLVADTDINVTFEYKPGMEIPVKGRGGTAYQPAIEYCNNADEEIDGLIYFGDGDAFDTPVKPGYPVLWAFTRKDTNPFSFGHFVKVDV